MKYPKSQMRGSGMNGRVLRRIQRRQELESIWRMDEPIVFLESRVERGE